jgi:pyruvate/2-oxoglutarate dehydrogenase complex dihydrolipoamide acyltransferase (E2) component
MSDTPQETTEPTPDGAPTAAGFPPGTGATGSDTPAAPEPAPTEPETPQEPAPTEAPAAPATEPAPETSEPAPGAGTEDVHTELVAAARALVDAIEGIYDDSGLRGEVVTAKTRVRDLLNRLEGKPAPVATPEPAPAA